MEIKIKVFPGSSKSKIIESKNVLNVYTKAQTKENAANKEMVKTLSKYYNLKEVDITIKKGQRSRNKTIEVKNDN